jgi:guanylate kinase
MNSYSIYQVCHSISAPTPRSRKPAKGERKGKSYLIVSCDKFGSLGDVGVIIKHAVCDYVVILVRVSFLGADKL